MSVCDGDVFWLLSTATSLNTKVDAFWHMNYRWTWASCPSLFWISKKVLPSSACGNTVCICDTVDVWVSLGVRAPEEAAGQTQMNEIMMSRAVITFLSLRRGEETEEGWEGFDWYLFPLHPSVSRVRKVPLRESIYNPKGYKTRLPLRLSFQAP